MSDSALRDATIIVHEAIAPVSDQDVEEALAPATFGARTTIRRLRRPRLKLEALADLDWAAVHDELVRELDSSASPAIDGTSGAVHYFGILPIPLAMEVGRRIGPARQLIAHQQRHDSKSWRWPSEGQTVTAALHGQPNTVCSARGDLIVRVSCSHPVSSEDACQIVPNAIGELHVSVDSPSEDMLRSMADVARVASLFGDALDCARRLYPNCETIHVFAAVPPALAIRLGAEINPTIHRPVQTYQFNGLGSPRYVRALVLGDRPRPPVSVEARQAADRARGALATALAQLRPVAAVPGQGAQWLANLIGANAAAALPSALHNLGPLGSNRMIVDSRVAMDVREAGGEFIWDPEERVWAFDDRLLAALAARLDGRELEQAGRLFLLHETVHATRQGLTSATAESVGRLPRVLEEADYVADVWAVVHEYGRALRSGDTDDAKGADFLRDLLRLMTATFWAFDAGDLPLASVQVRRLNRYLIWYWQRLALETVDTAQQAARVLGTEPVLEISGPRIGTSRGRVMFDLDRSHLESIELGVLVDGFRIVRVGSRAGARVGALLDAIRLGDEATFVSALRGVFDSVISAGG
jgi:hypothetical protein